MGSSFVDSSFADSSFVGSSFVSSFGHSSLKGSFDPFDSFDFALRTILSGIADMKGDE